MRTQRISEIASRTKIYDESTVHQSRKSHAPNPASKGKPHAHPGSSLAGLRSSHVFSLKKNHLRAVEGGLYSLRHLLSSAAGILYANSSAIPKRRRSIFSAPSR